MPQLSKMKENLVQNTFCLSPYEIQESQKDMIFTLELFHKFRGAFSGTSNSVYQVLFLRLIFWPKKGCWDHKGVHLEKISKLWTSSIGGGAQPYAIARALLSLLKCPLLPHFSFKHFSSFHKKKWKKVSFTSAVLLTAYQFFRQALFCKKNLGDRRALF